MKKTEAHAVERLIQLAIDIASSEWTADRRGKLLATLKAAGYLVIEANEKMARLNSREEKKVHDIVSDSLTE